MKKLILFLALFLMLSGCGKKEVSVEPDTAAFRFVDDLGRQIIMEKAPERVAVLLGSYADMWVLAGGEIVAAANDAWEDFHLELSEDVVNLGETKNLNLELLYQSNPDFVIASSNTSGHLEWMESLNQTKITTAYFEVNSFDDYLRVLDLFTDLTGKKENYEKYGSSLHGAIEELVETTRKKIETHKEAPKVLILRSSASWIRAKNSEGNVLGEMLFELGCINIADKNTTVLENINMEYILMEDPDYIFFTQVGDVTGIEKNINQFIQDNPAWSQLTAVKNDRVYIMEKEYYTLKPNANWLKAYQKVQEILLNE